MFWIDLLIGFVSGGIICFAWQQRQKQEVRRMLYSYSDRPDENISLAPLSSVRRELKALYSEKNRIKAEVDEWYSIIKKAPFGYLRVDADNQLLWCNRSARSLLHLNRWQSGQIRLLLELVRSYELDQLIEATRDSKTAQTKQWEFHPSHDAETLAASLGNSLFLRGSTLSLPQGDVVVFLENLEPLKRVERSQEQLLSDLAHELRTPLTAMRLVAESLEQRLAGLNKKWSQQLVRETNRLYYLVQDWLEISRLASHPHQVLSQLTFDLVALIHETWETLLPIATQKQITLQYEGLETLTMTGDRDRLTQVLINLFDNAIKYNPVAEPIVLRLTQTGDRQDDIQLEIIDQGRGFDVEDLPHIFERLYRGDQARARPATTTPTRKGSGLGLAIAKQIILAHSGTITAKNHPEHQGAWITVTLPSVLPSEDPDI
ncbi:MAG: HAMP domain-containing sensor histidine kinase [Limnothrix sp.]